MPLLESESTVVLVTTFAACQSPGGPGARLLEARIHGWMTPTKNFGSNLPLLFKMHEIQSVDSQENY